MKPESKMESEVLLPSDWFPSNAVRSETIWFRLGWMGILVLLVCFYVLPNLGAPISFFHLLGAVLIALFAGNVAKVVRHFQQAKMLRESPGQWCFCYFGVPNEPYTSAVNILVRVEFKEGVTLTGKGIDYTIPSHRVVQVDLDDDFSDLRIDWRADSGGTNSLFLLEFSDLNKDMQETWKSQILEEGTLDEKLPHDVTWLPRKEFVIGLGAMTICFVTVAVTVVTFEMVKRKWTIFPDALSYYSALIVACLLVLVTTFGFFVNRWEKDVLASAKAKMEH